MRSRIEVRLPGLALALLLWPGGLAGVAAVQAPEPTPAEIARAIEIAKADPNLAPLRTIRILRWRDSGTPRRTGNAGWLAWIADLFRWLDQTARVLVWGVVAALAAALLAYLVRLAVSRSDHVASVHGTIAPVRVHDLDIRPESLPDDIGGAARRLWDRYEHRAALALLYRGMLSRLAHVHQVPIRDATTEADCLVLASGHLETARSEYATRLVRIWQRAVYGREEIPDVDVYGLCDGFRAALDQVAAPEGSA